MKKEAIIALFLFLLSFGNVCGFEYVTWNPSDDTGDCTSYERPDQTKPAQGGSYTDQTFNSDITRITDYVADGADTIIQYTTFSCSNSDNTKVAFSSGLGTSVPGSYNKPVYSMIDNSFLGIIDISPGINPYPGGTQEFRWSQDPATPNLGYFRSKKAFYSVDISSGFPGVQTLIHDFTDDYPDSNVIQNNDKGEQSWGNIGGYYDRYWAFIAGDAGTAIQNVEDLIIYDRGTDTVYRKDFQELCSEQGWGCTGSVRWATMSPGGTYFAKIYDDSDKGGRLIALEPSGSDSLALKWSDASMSDWSHPTWGYTAEGEEFIFFCNVLPWISYWRVSDGLRVNLFRVGGSNSDCSDCTSGCGHEGCANHWSSSYNRNSDGWIFGTGYGVDNIPSEFLTEEVHAIRLSTDPDKQKVWRIAWTYDDSTTYAGQARAQLSQDGKNIYFASDFFSGVYSTQDIYRISLPDNWWDEIDDVIYQSCSSINGSCCSSGQICSGGDFQLSSDCGSLCCVVGVCLDTTPPTRSDPKPTSDLSAGTEQTTISLATDESATCRYSTSPGVSYSSMPDTFSTTGGTAHSEIIMDLTDGQTYNFYIRCSDSSGNHNTEDFLISFGVDIPFQGDTCDGLKLLMHFDEDSSIVTDHSGNGNDGAVNGAAFTSSGKFFGAFEYDGVDDYIDLGNDASLQLGNVLTISAWIRPTSVSERQTIIGQDELSGAWQFELGSGIELSTIIPGIFIAQTTGDAMKDRENIWTHVAYTRSGSGSGTHALYINGVSQEIGSGAENDFKAEGNKEIGRRRSRIQQFNGIIDEVAIWNRALSSDEIWELVDSGVPISCEESLCISGADTDNSDSVSMDEVIAFIEGWKTGSITIDQVIVAIGEWKSGC